MGGTQMAAAGMDVREDLTRQALIGFWEVLRHISGGQEEAWAVREMGFATKGPTFWFWWIIRDSISCWLKRPKEWEYRFATTFLQSLGLGGKTHPDHEKGHPEIVGDPPFEKEYFRKRGVEAIYVGNPLIEEMDLGPVKKIPALKKSGIPISHFPLICAMPGSRKGEINKIWPIYIRTSRLLRRKYPDIALVVPKPAGIDFTDYKGTTAGDHIYFVDAPAIGLRKVCDMAWVKSGTGTLETALLGTPQVVVYKVAALSGFIAHLLVHTQSCFLA